MQDRPTFIILKNKDRFRAFQCTFYHQFVCQGPKGGPGCTCEKREYMAADRKGEHYFAERSLFLAPRQQSEMLPPEVLDIPQVKAALDSGKLIEVTKRAPIQIFPGKE
jgi:hypothetical protein